MLKYLFFCLELLPSDVVCAKETRDLVIECCVGEHFRQVELAEGQASLIGLLFRIHSLDLVRGK